MPYRANPLVLGVAEPPIAEAQGWIEGRAFPVDRPLLNMAQAVPSYPPADALQDYLATAARQPDTSLYTEILGVPELRATLATHMAETYGADLDARDFGITAGCNQAFCVAMSALAGPGDEVILPAPWYFNHQMWLQMQGITPVSLHCDEMKGAMPDPVAAAALIGQRTRAIVLVTPNNPTGAIYPPALIAAFYELARERDIALVLDETYKDFMPGTAPPHDLFTRADWRDVFIQLYSFSKAYSLTGYRVGSVAGGPAINREDHGLRRHLRPAYRSGGGALWAPPSGRLAQCEARPDAGPDRGTARGLPGHQQRLWTGLQWRLFRLGSASFRRSGRHRRSAHVGHRP
jgi:aspartate/methionine/tyrosine aminotransferase